MRFKAVVLGVALSLLAGGTLRAEENPWGKDVQGRDPMRIWGELQGNPDVLKIKGTLASHGTWERNNVLKDGQYVADKATLKVEAGNGWFNLSAETAGSVASPLSGARWLFLWRYADVEESWGKHEAGDAVSKGSVVVNEGENQVKFPVYLGPSGEFLEVRLVSYKDKTLLYVMQPGTDKYQEEWILK